VLFDEGGFIFEYDSVLAIMNGTDTTTIKLYSDNEIVIEDKAGREKFLAGYFNWIENKYFEDIDLL
jgi:hypothetical protein